MFGAGKKLEYLEQEIRITLRQKDRRIEQLEREVEGLRSWGTKWREKAKVFRRANREIRDKTKETT